MGDSNFTFAPLHVDPAEEQFSKPRSWPSWLAFMQRVFPIGAIFVPRGRRSVELHLLARDRFVEEAWSEFDLALVRQLLNVIRTDMILPNDHFLPNDPLFLALIPDHSDCFPIPWFRGGIKREFGLDISNDQLLQMYDEGDWTVGRFAKFLDDALRRGQGGRT